MTTPNTPSLNRHGLRTAASLADDVAEAFGERHDALVDRVSSTIDRFHEAVRAAEADGRLSKQGVSYALRDSAEKALESIGKDVDEHVSELKRQARDTAGKLPELRAPSGDSEAGRIGAWTSAEGSRVRQEVRVGLDRMDPLDQRTFLREAAESGIDGLPVLLALESLGPFLRRERYGIDVDEWSRLLRTFGQSRAPSTWASLRTIESAVSAAEGVRLEATEVVKERGSSLGLPQNVAGIVPPAKSGGGGAVGTAPLGRMR